MFSASKRVTTSGTILALTSLAMGLFHCTLVPIVSHVIFIGFACLAAAIAVVILGILVNPIVALVLIAACIDSHVSRKLRSS